jgi:hypothetical protein
VITGAKALVVIAVAALKRRSSTVTLIQLCLRRNLKLYSALVILLYRS